MTRFKRALLAGLAIVVIAACTFVQQKTEQNQGATSPTPVTQSSTPPTTPGQSTDVASIAIFRYSTTCAAGVAVPNNGSDVIPDGCTMALLTATPKTDYDRDGDGKKDDSTNHGDAITWAFVNNDKVVSITPGESNPLFNREVRTVTPRKQGSFTAKVSLVSGGKTFTAERTFRVE